MGGKGFSAVLVALGLGVVTLSVAADAIGIGPGDYVFGWEQMAGVAVGMTVAWFAGLRLLGWSHVAVRRPSRAGDSQHTAAASA